MQRFQYRNPRFQVNDAIEVSLASGEVLQGHCIDISAEGMCAELPRRLPLDTNLKLRLTAQGETLALAAKVSYYDGDRCGLVFQFTSGRERDTVEGFLQRMRRPKSFLIPVPPPQR